MIVPRPWASVILAPTGEVRLTNSVSFSSLTVSPWTATVIVFVVWSGANSGWWPVLWFLLKVFVIVYVYVWVRATLPRVRYDRLMAFGWKFLIPVGLLWVLATGAVIVLPDVYGRRAILIGGAVVAAVLLVVMLVWPLFASNERRAREVTS